MDNTINERLLTLKPKGSPVGTGQDRTGNNQENDQEDNPTAYTAARAAPAKAKSALQPIKEPIEKK